MSRNWHIRAPRLKILSNKFLIINTCYRAVATVGCLILRWYLLNRNPTCQIFTYTNFSQITRCVAWSCQNIDWSGSGQDITTDVSGAILLTPIPPCTISTWNTIEKIIRIFTFLVTQRKSTVATHTEQLLVWKEPMLFKSMLFKSFGMLFSFFDQTRIVIKTISLTKYTGILYRLILTFI